MLMLIVHTGIRLSQTEVRLISGMPKSAWSHSIFPVVNIKVCAKFDEDDRSIAFETF